MKKISILTTSTGEGHNQAAKSISTTLEKSDYEVIIHDYLKSKNLDYIVNIKYFNN